MESKSWHRILCKTLASIRNNLIEEIKAKLAPENTEPDKRTLFFSPMDIKELLSQENKEELFFLREFGLDGVDESKIGPLDFHQRFLVQHNQVYGDVIDFFKDESIERWVNGFQRLMEDWGMNFLDQLKTDRGIHHFLNDQILSEGYQFVAPTFKVLNTMTCGLIAAWFTNLSDFENVYSFWEEKFADEERHQFMWEIRSLRGLLEEDAT